MNKLFFLILVCLLTIIDQNHLSAYASAHVIVTTYDVDDSGTLKKYVIFGLTKKGFLSTFGGLRNPGESDPKDTAAREAEEETLGILGNKNTVRNMLVGLDSITNNSDHLCYMLPQKKYDKNFSQKFKQIRFDKSIKLPYSKREMVDLVAVEVDLLKNKVFLGKNLVFKDNCGVLRPLRSATQWAIIKSVKEGHL